MNQNNGFWRLLIMHFNLPQFNFVNCQFNLIIYTNRLVMYANSVIVVMVIKLLQINELLNY